MRVKSALFTFAKDALRANQGHSAKLLTHKNGSGAATRNSSETSIKHKMLRIEPRFAFINGVLLANRVLIFRFQLLAVYVLLVHNCGECRISTNHTNKFSFLWEARSTPTLAVAKYHY
jgi:hypothetical protein